MAVRRRFTLALIVASLIGAHSRIATAAPAAKVVEGSATDQQGNVVAGPDGATLQITAGTRLELGPGTRVRELMRSARLYLGPEGRTPTYVVELLEGRIDAHVDKDAEPRRAVLVRAPFHLSAIVRSGSAVVIARDRRSVIANRGGDVLVARDSEWTELPAHQARVASERARKTPERHDLLSAPRWDGDSRTIWLAASGAAGLEGLGWHPVDGASSYHVEVFRPGEAEPVTAVWTPTPSLDAPVHLPAGLYEARVRAIDGMGLEGTRSAPLPLRVVGLDLPPGGRADDSKIVRLAKGQSVRLVNASGLLVTHGVGGRWRPSEEPIGMFRDRPLRVFLRAPGRMVAESFVMKPEPLVRRIDFEPKNPVWPGQPLRVTLELSADADTIDSPKLMVGVSPIDVAWQRDGRVWTAEVPPQPGPGPWVTRVEVRDTEGQLVGRNFVEIARRRPEPWMAPPPRATPNDKATAWAHPKSSISPATSSTRARSASSTPPSGDD